MGVRREKTCWGLYLTGSACARVLPLAVIQLNGSVETGGCGQRGTKDRLGAQPRKLLMLVKKKTDFGGTIVDVRALKIIPSATSVKENLEAADDCVKAVLLAKRRLQGRVKAGGGVHGAQWRGGDAGNLQQVALCVFG